MMNYVPVTKIWYVAWWELYCYVGRFIDDDRQRPITSKAVALWFESAADGRQTALGPFRALFAMAEQLMQQADSVRMLLASQKLVDAIPIHQTTTACDLSRVYSGIWQVAQLCEWDRKTIHRVAKRISKLVPTESDCWYELEPAPFDDPVARLARRAFKVLHEHECDDTDICARAFEMWEREDKASDKWLETERLAREGI